MTAKLNSRWFHISLLLIWLVIGISLRLINLTAKPPWTDEFSTLVFSLGNSFLPVPLDQAISADILLKPLQPQAAAGFKDVWINLFTESNHPPIYFLLTHWWLGFFPTPGGLVSVWGARSLSAIFGAISVGAIYGLSWIVFRDRAISHITAAFMAVSPYGVFLAQEARHYTLAILWVIATFACLVVAARHINEHTQLPIQVVLLWVAINALGIATHYFFVLTLIAEGIALIFLAIRNGKKQGSSKYEIQNYETQNYETQNLATKKFVVQNSEIKNSEIKKPRENKSNIDNSGKNLSENSEEDFSKTFRFGFLLHPPWRRIYLVAMGTAISALVWLPVFLQNSYGNKLTDWIQGERSGLAWISPIFQALAAWITMIVLLPVEAPQLSLVIASGFVMLFFLIWTIPTLFRSLKVNLEQPQTELMSKVFVAIIFGAVGLFFIFTYFLGIDLTRGARYNFVYFPAVVILLGSILAVCWRTPIVKFWQWRITGKQAVSIIWLVSLISSITVIYNLGYQKYYRPDLFVELIQNTSKLPVLIATTQKTHVQIGEMIGVAREFKIQNTTDKLKDFQFFASPRPSAPPSPLFLLAHQDEDPNTSSIVLENTLKHLPRPFDLWLVNFYAPTQVDNCVRVERRLPQINGYNYELYRCE
ncbi:glycosyltransferase family 39 protein [Mastigocoleus testarum]|uniref:Glycosyltransferase n=1 Tax=Mastigocoleus testarum BC008 TaxID=371196 RepID=A0A0V7ZGD2_9CYAN|nr:glycosyl transferase [Mastigocoleus testarum]KST63286.1 glycosyltransferase [Mastigocoleus testarum BC008]